MIALISLHGLRAVLTDDGEWKSRDQKFAQLLNLTFNTKRYPPTLAAGTTPFNNQVRAVQEQWKAKVRWVKKPQHPKGTIT